MSAPYHDSLDGISESNFSSSDNTEARVLAFYGAEQTNLMASLEANRARRRKLFGGSSNPPPRNGPPSPKKPAVAAREPAGEADEEGAENPRERRPRAGAEAAKQDQVRTPKGNRHAKLPAGYGPPGRGRQREGRREAKLHLPAVEDEANAARRGEDEQIRGMIRMVEARLNGRLGAMQALQPDVPVDLGGPLDFGDFFALYNPFGFADPLGVNEPLGPADRFEPDDDTEPDEGFDPDYDSESEP